MNRFLLFLLLLPKGLWRVTGADVSQLKAILKVKLMLDDRRPLAMGKSQRKRKKPVRFMTLLSVFLSAVFGIIYSLPLALDDAYMGLWMYFTLFLVMLSMMLITDFSTVLFDGRDKYIIFPRPVNERTLLLSRLLHMFVYLFRIVLPMSLAGWIAIGFSYGWRGACWFPIAIILLTLVALFIVNAAYLLVLHFAKPEKFKDVINYFQVTFSILFFACVYLMPKVMQSDGFQQLKYTDFLWAQATPTFWLAASFSWFFNNVPSATLYWVGILAIVGPAILMWLTIKYLSPSFAKRIGTIDTIATESSTSDGVKTEINSKEIQSSKLYLRLANLLNKNPLSKAGFSIAWLQTGRNRNFKMRVLPMFAYVPVYFFFLISQNNKPIGEIWATLHQTNKHILLLYISSFVVMQLMAQLVYSDQYKASWLYYSSPIAKPGAVMAGALKAVWVKYFTPIYIVISLFVLSIWGYQALSDVILAYINISFFALCIMLISYRRLPFSAMEQMNEKGSRFLKGLFVMILPMSFGFGHYWVSSIAWLWWLKLIFIVLSCILVWMVWDSYKNTNWNELKKMDID